MSARILIVEDECITAEDLRETLLELGYLVTAIAQSGAGALAQVEIDRPDLVLMDIQIHGNIDGAETARLLHVRFNIPVVYLTAHTDRATLQRARLAGPLGYITKPFRQTELHASIATALQKHCEQTKSQGATTVF